MQQYLNPFGAPDTPAFGGGITETLFHPVAAGVLLAAGLLMLVLPRRHVLGPMLCAVFLIPLGQQVLLGGVHWLAPRLVVLCALVRVIFMKASSRGAHFGGGVTQIDRAFFGCVLAQMLAVMLLNSFQIGAVLNQFGFFIDFALAYFVIRVLVQDIDDVYRALRWLVVIVVLLGAEMVWEQQTHENLFGIMGGTAAIPAIREGRARSHGVFQHALTAGTFAATLVPLFILLWRNGKARAMAALGLAGATVMTVCSNSSTPLLAYVAGIAGVFCWPIRRNLRVVRWGISLSLVALHMVMQAPVWFLIARIDLTGGSSGYHRAELVDQFIRRFGEWWLIGTNNAGRWGYDLWDSQNQFVGVGQTGGLVAFILFILVISGAWSRIGTARRMVDGQEQESLMWLLGAALFANVVAFFGVNYFDQSKVSWFLLLSMISAATAQVFAGKAQAPVAEAPKPEARKSSFAWVRRRSQPAYAERRPTKWVPRKGSI